MRKSYDKKTYMIDFKGFLKSVHCSLLAEVSHRMSMLFVKPHLIKSLYEAKKGTLTVAPYSHCSAKNDKNIKIIFTTNSSNKILV